MITTQNMIDLLANRIEQAYHRRHPGWRATGVTPGVWVAAAVRLNEVANSHQTLPVDPELFVAIQDYQSFRRDPWCELTQEGSATIYRMAVRKIIRQLKKELAAELRWSRRFLESGRTMEDLLSFTKSRVSPIAKFALCMAQDRDDLAAVVRPAAEDQHQACPLYRFASKNLFPRSDYPGQEARPTGIPNPTIEPIFAWN